MGRGGGREALAMVFSDSLTLYQQGRTHYFRPASGSRFPRSPYIFELVQHCPKLRFYLMGPQGAHLLKLCAREFLHSVPILIHILLEKIKQ